METQKQVTLGGGASQPQTNIQSTMAPKKTFNPMIDEEFLVPTDIVTLPSLGKFYPNGQKTVEIKYLTADDENILLNTDLIRSGRVLDALLDNCIVSEGISTEEMLAGDKNKILIDVRINGYGTDYEVDVIDPETGEPFTTTVDLSKLKSKTLEIEPDSLGEYTVKLPKFGVDVKFRFLTGEDEDILSKKEQASKNRKKGLNVSRTLTDRYVRQIMEVKGNRDKLYIQKFISAMPIKDSFFLREYIRELEPGINLNYEFTSPSGNVFEADVPLTTRLFWPSSKI